MGNTEAGSQDRLDVEVQEDHLERLATCRPSAGLAELIWNSLDADATEVRVEFVRNGLGGVETIRVIDDGVGIGGEGQDTDSLFRKLGGSWKQAHRETRSGRAVHGQAGEGRFKAFALGNTVTWKTRRLDKGNVAAFELTRVKGSPSFRRTRPAPTKDAPGTVVEVREVFDKPAPDSQSFLNGLCQEFALYLLQYPSVKVFFDGKRIDPRSLSIRTAELEDVSVDTKDRRVSAKLMVIEWSTNMGRALYLCTGDGFALSEVSVGIQAPGFFFTAYLKSEFFPELKAKNLLDSELAPGREEILEAARRSLREYFRTRAAEQALGAVQLWRSEKIYPYEGTPASPVENVERQVFDICALSLTDNLPDFGKSDAKQKKFTFRLLKNAIEENPSALQAILSEVLDLPKDKQDELAELLRQTSLSAIINAAKIVADRIEFLTGLEHLLFEPESKKQLLERRQLHRLLAPNAWLFGEEFNLTADDESLNTVLERHLARLGRSVENDAPVVRDDGREGIVDLMLSRVVPWPDTPKCEHLVVELKRPKQPVDSKALQQIKDYAFAVAADDRFRDTSTRWKFMAVSNELSGPVQKEASQKGRPAGLVYEADDQQLTIWIFTWGQLIERARGRLEFFRKALEYSASRESAQAHLRKVYEKYLPKPRAEHDSDNGASGTRSAPAPESP
jgi:hypothetical protein